MEVEVKSDIATWKNNQVKQKKKLTKCTINNLREGQQQL